MNETVEKLKNGADPSEVLSEQRMATFQDLEDLRDWVFGGTGINAAINDVFNGSMVDDEITNEALVLDFRAVQSNFTANLEILDQGLRVTVRSNDQGESISSEVPEDRRELAKQFLRNTEELIQMILSIRVAEWTP